VRKRENETTPRGRQEKDERGHLLVYAPVEMKRSVAWVEKRAVSGKSGGVWKTKKSKN